MGAGIAVGAACTALTAGAGSVACAVLGTAVSGVVGGALDCPPGKSMAGCVGRGAVDAVIAPVTDTVGCLSDPTTSGCAAAAMSVIPGGAGHAASKFGGKYLKRLDGECNYFAAGTTVETDKGRKPIEKVRAGDKIRAKDMVTGEQRLRRVAQTASHVDTRMMSLVVGALGLGHPEHPFHTPDRGWVQSGELRTGDRVSPIDGRRPPDRHDHPLRHPDPGLQPRGGRRPQLRGHRPRGAGPQRDVRPCGLLEGKGHHIPAKKMFEGDAVYDMKAAPAIPLNYLRGNGISHPTITGSQASQYSAFAKTGQDLTWNVVEDIETRALIRGGVPGDLAGPTVHDAITQLQQQGVSIQQIPWGRR